MAAALLKDEDLEQEYRVGSRGLVVLFPEPINPKAEAIMKAGGRTLEGHCSQVFEEEDLQEDTLILTMDKNQKDKILTDYLSAKNIYTLAEFAEENEKIPYPYGKPLKSYGKCYETMEMLIKKLAIKLNNMKED